MPIQWVVCLAVGSWLACALLAAQSDPGSKTASFRFVNATQRLGIAFVHASSATPLKYLPETMGSGVALFDFNGDSRLDIFFGNGAHITAPMPPGAEPSKDDARYFNRLYEQGEDGAFRDVTDRAGLRGEGYSTGVAVGDYDNDGYPDLFVGGVGSNHLYRNNGNGTFKDVTGEAGVAGAGWASSVAWLDFDHDGWLDLIVGRYLEWSFDKDLYCGTEAVRAYCHPDNFPQIAPILFRNLQNGRFEDVSAVTGVAGFKGKALGLGIADIDRDGRIDLFIANDGMAQFLLRNQGNGTLEEVALFTGVAMDQDGNSFAGMGVDVADYNNDGHPDIVVTNLSNEAYALYRNEGDGNFIYASDSTGLSKISLLFAGWGVRFIDYDNDGWRDLFIIQGHVLDTIEITSPHLRYAQPPFLLRNEVGKAFQNVSQESGDVFLTSHVGRGLAVGDLDNDGDLDVVVSNLNEAAAVFINEGGNGGNWLIVEPEGTASNRDGIGAEMTVTLPDGDTRFATVTTTSSYQSSSDHRVHFGLGNTVRLKSLEIRWPSGALQRLEDVVANQVLRVKEPRREDAGE